MKDPFHIKAVSGAGFIIRASLEVGRQLPGSSVVYDSGVVLTNAILGSDEYEWDFGGVPVMGHLGVVVVDGVEGRLVL